MSQHTSDEVTMCRVFGKNNLCEGEPQSSGRQAPYPKPTCRRRDRACSGKCRRERGGPPGGRGRRSGHIVALLAVGTRSTMAQTGVSGPVVVDGESFLDALFAIGCNSRVEVDDGSTGGNRLEAVSRPRTAGCSETPDRGGQS
eukprot:scaffold5740_cov65-Phaeocystis_antarctica.AAC.1